MGLFGKIFEKKICSICGNEIGLLGNRKLEDGNCCKECAAKLSPWFSDRRNSTVREIKSQLEYRENNKQEVEKFHATKTLGRYTKVILDEDAHRFIVTSAKDWKNDNPDVLDYKQVTGCDFDINELTSEVEREVKKPDGTTETKSYNPPRYLYSYDFFITINVNHEYFNQIRFKLNSSDVEVVPASRATSNVRFEGSVCPPTVEDKMNNVDYAEYETIGQEIKDTMLNVREQIRENIIEQNTPKASVKCPHCGATTVPTANGCCEFCGSALK